jgi:DNA polymerase-4
MDRSIVHMDLDSFFVSVERKLDPSLIGKPVLVGGSSDRGVVASCSYEARKFGIHSAMPMKQAKRLCPEAIVVSGSHSDYSKYSGEVTDIIRENVPVYEKTSIDEFYIDLSGTDRFFGCYKLATELRQRIMRETGLPISFALSSNKTVSKIGTGQAKPNGQMEIIRGTEKEFLAPMSVQKIPMVGEKTYQSLKAIGIELIRDLQQIPVNKVEQVLGQHGISIWKKANGICDSVVEQYSEQKSMSSEQTFEKDTQNVSAIKALLAGMTEKLAYDLRAQEKLTACVTIKLRYSDFSTFTQQMSIPYTSLDHVLIAKVQELFDKLFNKRQFIRLIGVKFSHLVQGSYQFDLFEDTGEHLKLLQAMDNIRNRFGKDAVSRAVAVNMRSFDFNPFNGVQRSEKAISRYDAAENHKAASLEMTPYNESLGDPNLNGD